MKQIPTTKKHFEIFKDECNHWAKEWKLDDWKLSYQVAEIKGRGECYRSLEGCMATITLCKYWEDTIRPICEEEIREVAKHEMLHVLLGRLGTLNYCRFVTIDAVDEAEHALLNKLMELL